MVKEDVKKIIENIPRLIKNKRLLQAYLKEKGSLEGFDDKRGSPVKPLCMKKSIECILVYHGLWKRVFYLDFLGVTIANSFTAE